MDTNESLPIPEQPEEQKSGATTQVTARFAAMYVGAVPPPEILDAYERHLPGATERFIEMVENEQRMQYAIANRNLDLQERQEANATKNFRLGLKFSFALMSILFLFMFVCAFLRLENVLIYALGVPVLTALGGIVSQFIWKRKK